MYCSNNYFIFYRIHIEDQLNVTENQQEKIKNTVSIENETYTSFAKIEASMPSATTIVRNNLMKKYVIKSIQLYTIAIVSILLSI